MATKQHACDRRLGVRIEQLLAAMVRLRTVSIAALAAGWAQQMAFYRLLANTRLEMSMLTERLYRWMDPLKQHPGRHVLLIQDTTECDFEAHRGRIRDREGLGWLRSQRRWGFCLHPALVVDALQERAYGFADVQVYARPVERSSPRRSYRDLPIEEKESHRWIRAITESIERLRRCFRAVHVTVVADREADIYSVFARLPAGCDAVIRSCRNRRILEQPGDLYGLLALAPEAGRERVFLRGDLRRRRTGRWVTLRYRFARVTLRRPERSAKPDAEGRRDPKQLVLWAVLASDEEGTVCWRLLTTHPVRTLEEAKQVVAWYRRRWYIEQVFRLLKADGLDLEASELERGVALQRLAVLALAAALDVMRLLLAEREGEEQPLSDMFTAAEVTCLERLNARLEGRTAKQRNPHAEQSLAWGAWVIARLGGWSGFRSQRRAGPKIFHRGLERFHLTCFGIQLQDVYKP